MDIEQLPLIAMTDGDELSDIPVNFRKKTEPCMGGCLDWLGCFFGCFCSTITCGGCCNSCDGCCYPYKTVKRGYRGVVSRFGTITHIVSDGLHYVNPVSESLRSVDVMLHVKKLANQSVLTKDNLPITIDGAVYYYVNNAPADIIKANYYVYNVSLAVDELAHSTLRLVFGQHTLQEALEKRKEFGTEIKNILGQQASSWGIVIQDIQIIDVVLPKHIQDLLSTSAIAVREGEAEIIMATARVKSAHLMREAADQLNTPAAMQMRMLETYKVLAESENSKIIFMPGIPEKVDNITANVIGDVLRTN